MEKYDLLVVLASACRANEAPTLHWPQILRGLGFQLPEQEWHQQTEFWKVILEQIEDGPNGLRIRGVLGSTLYRYRTVDSIAEWHKTPGPVEIRHERFAHVGSLREGDVLITGERAIMLPREGGNNTVLVPLSCSNGEETVQWITFPRRAALALEADREPSYV